MRDLKTVLERCAAIVQATVPEGMRWRLLVVGSAASGEVTVEWKSTDFVWKSDVELYLQSPDPGLDEVLTRAGALLRVADGPRIDLAGASPDTIAKFAPRQWLVDAGRVGRRIAGSGDDWREPFARFASAKPGPEDALVLLANRCAEFLDPHAEELYALAKCVLDTVSAALILRGEYRSSIRERIRALSDSVIVSECLESGMDWRLVDCARKAAEWKLTGTRREKDAFLESVPTALEALKSSVPRLVAAASKGRGSEGLESLRRWIRGRSPIDVVRDWSRALLRSRSRIVEARFPLDFGPLWGARLEVLDAFVVDRGRERSRQAHRRWVAFAKGV